MRRSDELNKMALKGLSTEQIDQLMEMMKIVKGNLMMAAEEIQEKKNGAA